MVSSKALSLEGFPAITLIFRNLQRARHLPQLNISLQNLWSFEDVEFYMCRKFPVSESVHAGPAGSAAAVRSRLDGSLHVAQRQRPRQLLHPLPDGSGGPAGHGAAGAQLPLPVAHRRPGQRRGGLSQPPQLEHPALAPSSALLL